MDQCYHFYQLVLQLMESNKCPVFVKQLLNVSVFELSRIMKVEVGVITLTETLIILVITKTESNNCFIIH